MSAELAFCASTVFDAAFASLSALRSSTGCDSRRRASYRLNGPTSCGMPGALKPKAARLIFSRAAESDPETSGSRPLIARQCAPSDD